jgi:hypothetical protein
LVVLDHHLPDAPDGQAAVMDEEVGEPYRLAEFLPGQRRGGVQLPVPAEPSFARGRHHGRLVIATGKKNPSPATVMRMLREHDEKTAVVVTVG